MRLRTGLALAALVLMAAPGPRRASAGSRPAMIDFIFSGDLAGYLEPCG